MSTVIPLETGGYRVFTKGASEIIMSKCSFIFGEGGRIDKFTKSARERAVKEVIEPMARDGLRTISLAYRDFVTGKAEINQVATAWHKVDVKFTFEHLNQHYPFRFKESFFFIKIEIIFRFTSNLTLIGRTRRRSWTTWRAFASLESKILSALKCPMPLGNASEPVSPSEWLPATT